MIVVVTDFSKAWLETKAAAMREGAYLFIEGYEWTGLAVWRNGVFELPSPRPGETSFTWRLSECEDIRLFDGHGEWHCWRTGNLWKTRWQVADDWRDNHLERKYVLWGRKAEAADSWWRVSEANGTSLAIPFQPREPLDHSPLRFLVRYRIDEDQRTGQQYVGDAMLLNLIQAQEAN